MTASDMKIFLVAIGLFLAAPACAQIIGQSEEPIDIFGDHWEVVEKVITINGNARAVQAEGVLTAAKFVAVMNEEQEPQTIDCQGGVRYTNGKESVAGDTALYDDAARTITFNGNVVVTQGENVITGGNLIYWIDTGRISLTPTLGKRVRGFFKGKPAAAG